MLAVESAREGRQLRVSLSRRLAVVGVWLSLSLCVSIGCGSSKADHSKDVGEVRPVHWSVAKPIGERTLKLAMAAPYCEIASPREEPRILRLRERSIGRNLGITVLVHFPPHSKPGELVGCPGAERILHTRVKLRWPVDTEAVYDDSTTPPARRWPYGG